MTVYLFSGDFTVSDLKKNGVCADPACGRDWAVPAGKKQPETEINGIRIADCAPEGETGKRRRILHGKSDRRKIQILQKE